MPPVHMPNKHRDPDIETPTLLPRGTTVVLSRILAVVVAIGVLFAGLSVANKYVDFSGEEPVQELYVPAVANSNVNDVVQGLRRAGFEEVRVTDGKSRPITVYRGWIACSTKPPSGTPLPINERLVIVAENENFDCQGRRK